MPNFLKTRERFCGPDLLRPGSTTGNLGQGKIAFIYSQFPDDSGERLFTAPALIGHEQIVMRPNVQKALFGKSLPVVLESASYLRTLCDEAGQEIGTVTDVDRWEVRRRALQKNLLGRYGRVRGQNVFMLWNLPSNIEPELGEVFRRLEVPDDAILTLGTMELGLVREVVMELEEEFDVTIPDEEAEKIKTVGDAIDYLAKRNL
jgi:acyl carrier protein